MPPPNGAAGASEPPPADDNVRERQGPNGLDWSATVARLAALPELEYERVRIKEAEGLGVRVSALDSQVSAARGSEPGGSPKQGRALTLPAPEPWPEPADGAVLLGRLAAFYTRHVFLPIGAADAMAVWTVHTHCFALFRHSARLAFTSPEKRCGKTTALDTTALVCCKPLSLWRCGG